MVYQPPAESVSGGPIRWGSPTEQPLLVFPRTVVISLSSRHKSGSHQSTKVVAAAAKHERLVCARAASVHIDGILVGMDDYHWVILDRNETTHLVHKSLAVLSIHADGIPSHQNITAEEYKDLTSAAEGFRQHMMKVVYHQPEGEGVALSSKLKERTP